VEFKPFDVRSEHDQAKGEKVSRLNGDPRSNCRAVMHFTSIPLNFGDGGYGESESGHFDLRS
jgi:hypothetical protein